MADQAHQRGRYGGENKHLTVRVDQSLDDHITGLFWLYSGGAEGARVLLSTVAGSMITVAGVTFS